MSDVAVHTFEPCTETHLVPRSEHCVICDELAEAEIHGATCRCGDLQSFHADGSRACSVFHCGCLAFAELKDWTYDGGQA